MTMLTKFFVDKNHSFHLESEASWTVQTSEARVFQDVLRKFKHIDPWDEMG